MKYREVVQMFLNMFKGMTKKQVFAAFGIKFDGDRKVYCEPLKAWIPLPLVNGNDKIGKGVWHHSTLPGTKPVSADIIALAFQSIGIDIPAGDLTDTCKGTCGCDCKGCYAKSGNYLYDDNQAALLIRTYIARMFPDWLESCIIAQIIACKITMVRIHAAGDFFSNEHVRMWVRIARIFVEYAIFWTYTKTAFVALKEFQALDNCNIVKSLVNGGVNYGKAGYLIQLYHELKEMGVNVWICSCGLEKFSKPAGYKFSDEEKAAWTHCNKCNHCFTAEYVLFLEHGTGYNARKDPDLAEFLQLVASQEQTAKQAA